MRASPQGDAVKNRTLGLCAAALTLALAAGSGAATEYRQFTLGPGFLPDPQVGTGVTGGPVDASARFGAGCVGMIDTTPDHVIDVTAPVDVQLSVQSSTDATLVVTGPTGTACDDDSAGMLDPALSMGLERGRYEVYLGHFGRAGEYTLRIREGAGGAAASSGGSGSRYRDFTLGAGFLPDPQQGTGRTGGRERAAEYGRHCIGDIDDTPDHRLTVTSTVSLRMYVESEGDASLVVVGPGSVRCDDDSHGQLDPEINDIFAPGNYEIYVGHIGRGGEYVLTLTEN